MRAVIIGGCWLVVWTASVTGGAGQNRGSGGGDAAVARIVGRAQVYGTPAPAARIRTDAVCAKLAPAPQYDEALVADATGGLRNVFVFVKEGLDPAAGVAVPADPVVLTQRQCRFEPRVLGVQAGQPLAIVNEDATLHNVHAKPQINAPFNIGQPTAGMRATQVFTRPELMVPLTSDIRPWMTAFVAVVTHPFFAVSGPDGTFAIEGVPPGQYTLEARHETLGTATDRITVGRDQTASVSFTFTAK